MSVNADKSGGGHCMEKGKPQIKLVNDDTNPCLKEAEISRKCLEDHLYVREECQMQYDNYNQCKKFWAKIRSERKHQGIKPHLPKREERDKILELKKKGINVNSVS